MITTVDINADARVKNLTRDVQELKLIVLNTRDEILQAIKVASWGQTRETDQV